MTEQNDDLGGYTGEVVERKNFENENKGKPLLNPDDEYVFRLIKFPRKINTSDEKKNPDGSTTTVPKVKAVCEFEELASKNIVVTMFRVDKLNFGEDEKFTSGVVKFFRKIGSPLTENKYPDWKEKFVVNMRFRGRVVVKTEKDKDNNTVTKYYLDVPTVRKLQPSDTAGESFSPSTPSKSDASLANALLLCKGASDFNTAMSLLKSAQASKEVTMALFQANLDGKVTFPI
jgi:hypothetical protein